MSNEALKWDEYLRYILETNTVIDRIHISYNEDKHTVSPIIKSSILMLDHIVQSQGAKNIFVFPESEYLLKEFLLAKTIYNIGSGKIQMDYDPWKFQKGQKLKYKNCVVEFDRVEKDRIWIKLSSVKAPLLYSVPIGIMPFFQVTDSNRRISTDKKFFEVYSARDALATLSDPTRDEDIITRIENHITHLDASIIYVSEKKPILEYLTSVTISGRKASDILYIADVNKNGELQNLVTGRLSGNPAIILVSDLFYTMEILNQGIKVQSVIFDATRTGEIEKQLPAFDEINTENIPVLCITDTINSFDLNPLANRGYHTWRWDKSSITKELYAYGDKRVSNKIFNCKKQNIRYISIVEEHLTKVVNLLYKQRKEIEAQSAGTINIYEKLFSNVMALLRRVTEIDETELNINLKMLDTCSADLEKEKKYISKDLFMDLTEVAKCLHCIYRVDYQNLKTVEIHKILDSKKYKNVWIVIPDNLDRSQCEKYWKQNRKETNISLLYPLEINEADSSKAELTIISGWFSKKIMRKLLYGYTISEIIVLNYTCEDKWRKAHTTSWEKTLTKSDNKKIVEEALNYKGRRISSQLFDHVETNNSRADKTDELTEIEHVIKEAKYQRYGSGTSATICDAYPVSFLGGYMAFFRTGHKIINATGIINKTREYINTDTPDNLSVGDFIVIRESNKDIIREIADVILERDGKQNCRRIAAKWKESLDIESCLSTQDELIALLRKNGCKKNEATIKDWLQNEDRIIPKDKEDLLVIAAATQDEILHTYVDKIYDAGKIVWQAHTEAGRVLSKRLKEKIANHIQQKSTIDTFNVWDPITLQIEDVGTVRILKIIDIGDIIQVDSGNTNRLILEQ